MSKHISKQVATGSRVKHPPLAQTHPALAAEWHPTLNGDLSPETVTPGSSRRIWWRCAEHPEHVWEAPVAYRTARGAGCPGCYDPYRPRSGKALIETHPHVAAEWHPARNGSRTPSQMGYGSRQKAWWLCSTCGHEWESVIAERARTGGCPSCSGQTVTSANSLRTLRPDLARQWHPTRNGELTPDEITAMSARAVWWQCGQCSYEWEAAPGRRGQTRASCPSCSGQHLTELNSLATKAPAIAAEWHPELNGVLTPRDLTARSSRKVWWLCPTCQMEYEMDPVHRIRRGSGCPGCAGRVDRIHEHEMRAAHRRQVLSGAAPVECGSKKQPAWSLEGRTTVGSRIRALRNLRAQERGRPMAQRELAERVGGLNRKDVMEIELDRRKPRRRTLQRFARALDCSVAYLEHGAPLPRRAAESRSAAA